MLASMTGHKALNEWKWSQKNASMEPGHECILDMGAVISATLKVVTCTTHGGIFCCMHTVVFQEYTLRTTNPVEAAQGMQFEAGYGCRIGSLVKPWCWCASAWQDCCCMPLAAWMYHWGRLWVLRYEKRLWGPEVICTACRVGYIWFLKLTLYEKLWRGGHSLFSVQVQLDMICWYKISPRSPYGANKKNEVIISSLWKTYFTCGALHVHWMKSAVCYSKHYANVKRLQFVCFVCVWCKSEQISFDLGNKSSWNCRLLRRVPCICVPSGKTVGDSLVLLAWLTTETIYTGKWKLQPFLS